MDISVVGAGTVGTAIAVVLQGAGHRVVAASGREATSPRVARWLPGVPVVEPTAAAASANVVFIGTPDDEVRRTAAAIAGVLRSGQVIVHLSGALGLDVLQPASDAGAAPMSMHPLQTFPDVAAALRRLPGASMAVTARDEPVAAIGERLARDAGARPFRLGEEAKPLYHAGAVFASNFVVAIAGAAHEVLATAGVPDAVARSLPLSRASLENAAELGAERALTGPAVRGDAGTVEGNLRALAAAAPRLVAAYVTLSRLALDLGERAGRLRAAERAPVDEVLDRWT
jgi:predicted short-subunit dehydrogenase-like oxidoreductase (DUF2520 family)